MARTKTAGVPEVGAEAPEFNLPSAQGGQLRLSMRTARGPVILVFYADGAEEDARYFGELARKEDEINMAGGTVVGIGVSEPGEARDFVRKTGLKSYLLYDYARAATRDYGLLEGNKKSGEHARPAAFVISGDHKVTHAWVGERPEPAELLAKISELTGLPKPAEEPEEAASGEEKATPKTPKKAPDEATDGAAGEAAGGAAAGGAEKPKKMSAEERERIKAERRAARAEGKSLKQPGAAAGGGAEGGGEATERKRLSPEEREKRRAERRAAREAGGAGEAAKPEAGGDANEGPKGNGKGDAGEAGGEG